MDIPATVIASYYDDLQQAGIVDFDIYVMHYRFATGRSRTA